MSEMSKGLYMCVCIFDDVLNKRCLPSQATSLIIYQALWEEEIQHQSITGVRGLYSFIHPLYGEN